jgi:hydrogenase maturation protease
MDGSELRLFVGIGSPHGDDHAGWVIADRLRERVTSWSDVLVRRAAVPMDLLDWLDGVGHLHICDACYSGTPPGTLRRWDWFTARNDWGRNANRPPLETFAALRSTGSHDCGLRQTLLLGERLGRLPSEVTIWGIEGREFGPAQSLSAEIQAALSPIVGIVFAELTGGRN